LEVSIRGSQKETSKEIGKKIGQEEEVTSSN